MNKLAEENIDLVYHIVFRMIPYFEDDIEKEDYIEAGLFGLAKAIKSIELGKYDGNISKQSTYIGKCIENEISRTIISRQRIKRKSNLHTIKLDKPLKDGRYRDFKSNINIPKYLEKKEMLKWVRKCTEKLNPEDKDIITKYYFEEMYMKDIAKMYGCSKQNTHQKIRTIERRLKKIMQKEYEGWK